MGWVGPELKGGIFRCRQIRRLRVPRKFTTLQNRFPRTRIPYYIYTVLVCFLHGVQSGGIIATHILQTVPQYNTDFILVCRGYGVFPGAVSWRNRSHLFLQTMQQNRQCTRKQSYWFVSRHSLEESGLLIPLICATKQISFSTEMCGFGGAK